MKQTIRYIRQKDVFGEFEKFGVSRTFTKMLLVGPLEEMFSNLLERWFALGR